MRAELAILTAQAAILQARQALNPSFRRTKSAGREAASSVGVAKRSRFVNSQEDSDRADRWDMSDGSDLGISLTPPAKGRVERGGRGQEHPPDPFKGGGIRGAETPPTTGESRSGIGQRTASFNGGKGNRAADCPYNGRGSDRWGVSDGADWGSQEGADHVAPGRVTTLRRDSADTGCLFLIQIQSHIMHAVFYSERRHFLAQEGADGHLVSQLSAGAPSSVTPKLS